MLSGSVHGAEHARLRIKFIVINSEPGSWTSTLNCVLNRVGVAQWIAHLTSNQKVAGSSPAVHDQHFCYFCRKLILTEVTVITKKFIQI